MSSGTSSGIPAKPEQLWFFLREDITRPVFSQASRSLSDVKSMSIGLQTCLQLTNSKGVPADYAFYLHSESMAAAVRLLTDESIIATDNLYCQNDDVVLVIIRGKNDPSPNSSRAPSHQNSLKERRQLSVRRGAVAPNLSIQPKVRHSSEATDISSLEPIMDEDVMVSLLIGEDFATFSKKYLLGWINSKLSDFMQPADIVVQHCGLDGKIKDIRLTDEVWQHSLLRGPRKEDFAPLWDESLRLQCRREEILRNLTESVKGFHEECRKFIYDMRTYGRNKGARARLEGTGHQYYLGPPYFDKETREELLKLPTKRGTLELDLQALREKREGGTICA